LRIIIDFTGKFNPTFNKFRINKLKSFLINRIFKPLQEVKNIIIVGGGAAGFFTAINLAEKVSGLNISILEKDPRVLSKVKISGGGRCNVTNACFDVMSLVKNYPRGRKELIGPFNSFNPLNTIKWFEDRGVKLKTEDDGRVFPVTDKSQTIVDCFVNLAKENNIKIYSSKNVSAIKISDQEKFFIATKENEIFEAEIAILTTGNSKTIWNELTKLGHKIIEPVPSLFTFNIDDELLKDLSGVSVENTHLSIAEIKSKSTGPLLITHWGLSGPAVLSLSAFAAIDLNKLDYNFQLIVDWLPALSYENILYELKEIISANRNKSVLTQAMFKLPKRLNEKLIIKSGININKHWGDVSKKEVSSLAEILKSTKFLVKGKSTFKEEFVTAGGVDLREVNFKTMESKLIKNLFFAGEVLNIDAVTGGFNFQSAWTTGWIAADVIASRINGIEIKE
jgi:predicted Rossmann fold flavoprotein